MILLPSSDTTRDPKRLRKYDTRNVLLCNMDTEYCALFKKL
jgi:hypothetical protein